MSFQSHRHSSLLRAVAVSLLAHLLLLGPVLPVKPPVAERGALLARLTAPPMVRAPLRSGGPPIDRPSRRLLRIPERATTTASPPVAVASPVRAAGGDPEGEEVRGYRLSLARTASAFKRYPQQAVEAGWHGMVAIRVDIPASGPASESLLASSGLAMLDDAALQMIRQALPATPLPESMRGKAYSLTLPIVFELAE